MNNLKAKKILTSCLDELQSLDKLITDAGTENAPPLRTHGILRATGSLETACRIILTDALVQTVADDGTNSIYQHIRELTPEINIVTIKAALRQFNTGWHERFDKQILRSNQPALITAFHALTEARVKLPDNTDTQAAFSSIIASFKNVMLVMSILDGVVLDLHDETSNISAKSLKTPKPATDRELQAYATGWRPLPVPLNG